MHLSLASPILTVFVYIDFCIPTCDSSALRCFAVIQSETFWRFRLNQEIHFQFVLEIVISYWNEYLEVLVWLCPKPISSSSSMSS